jgi:hypothetical protein
MRKVLKIIIVNFLVFFFLGLHAVLYFTFVGLSSGSSSATSGAAGFAVTAKGLPFTGLRVPIERLTLTGLTVTAERFAFAIAWRTPIARERLTFPRLRIATVRLALSRLRIATKRRPFSGFRIPIEPLTLTVAGWSLAAGTIAVVFGRAKTARTRFAR